MRTAPRIWVFGLALVVALGWGVRLTFGGANRDGASDAAAMDFAKVLGADEARPRIEFAGRYESFSEPDGGGDNLEVDGSSGIRGVVDLTSRKCHFNLKGFKRKQISDREPYDTSDFTIVFDGGKWVVIRTPHDRTGFPWSINSMAEISAARPGMFLKSMDQLCFPLFGQLMDVTEDKRQVPLVEALQNPKVAGRDVNISRSGALVAVTAKSGIITDVFQFDSSKGHVMTRRDTDFNGGEPPDVHPERKIRNELIVSELVAVGDRWFPKVGTFRQYRGSKVTVERWFVLDEVKVVSNADPIFAAIPPYCLVTDNRSPATRPWNSSDASANLFLPEAKAEAR